MVTTTNTHVLVPEFELLEPSTLEEALAALAAHGSGASVMAGGTDLLVQMKLERRTPTHVVSLARIAELRRITSGDGLALGATASIHAVAIHPEVRERYTALAEACNAFSTVQIMMMGTVGGNLCNASPASDSAPALLVLDARVALAASGASREVPLAEFFTGPGRTVLRPNEVLRAVHLPARPASAGSAFVKIGRVAADISKVCAAVSVVRDGARIRECRIALGSVAPTPLRVPTAEAALTGERLSAGAIAEMERLVREAIAPITDARSTAAYRRRVAGVIAGDALRKAWARSGGGEVA